MATSRVSSRVAMEYTSHSVTRRRMEREKAKLSLSNTAEASDVRSITKSSKEYDKPLSPGLQVN